MGWSSFGPPYTSGTDDVAIFFNPTCAKCRTCLGLVEHEGIESTIVDYLADPPTAAELRVLMGQLGFEDPRRMMRTGEELYSTLALSEVSGVGLLEEMARHPILLGRPIVVHRGRAVIARPPERVFELLWTLDESASVSDGELGQVTELDPLER